MALIRAGWVVRRVCYDRAMLIHPIFPPTTGDHRNILTITGPALPLNAVEDILSILQQLHSALQFHEFCLDVHIGLPARYRVVE
jgi:hypothetical protein